MKTIKFDPDGGKLWVSISTLGLYHISFTFDLLEKDGIPTSTPVILTAPIIAGDNLDGKGEHRFAVVNAFHPAEAIDIYDGRFVNTSFFVRKVQDDAGFTIAVNLLQGDDPASAVDLGGDAIAPEDSTIGDSDGFKVTGIKFLIAKN